MKITVEIKTINKLPTSPLKATAAVLLDECFVIRNVKVIETEKGMFISLPSFRGRDGKWRSVCHPITREFHDELQNAVIEAYQRA